MSLTTYLPTYVFRCLLRLLRLLCLLCLLCIVLSQGPVSQVGAIDSYTYLSLSLSQNILQYPDVFWPCVSVSCVPMSLFVPRNRASFPRKIGNYLDDREREREREKKRERRTERGRRNKKDGKNNGTVCFVYMSKLSVTCYQIRAACTTNSTPPHATRDDAVSLFARFDIDGIHTHRRFTMSYLYLYMPNALCILFRSAPLHPRYLVYRLCQQ
ncbi:hypothetical protein HD806DRAFT_35351 [Xylariaceae sp. AK1471]|nr:hypothetical protein HD806DRAFT_35351 [Xylariaceae sp. AK1471]